MSFKIINLWTHPRSLSTAFYRIIYERGDFDMLFEPFVQMYYKKIFVRKRECRQYYQNKASLSKYIDIRDNIFTKSYKNNVFVKDMAYCVYDYVDDEYLKKSINIFLIRDPKKSLPSFYNILKCNYYFSDKFIKYLPCCLLKKILFKHTGYSKLWKLYERCNTFSSPLIINADNFEKSPQKTLKLFCNYSNIEYKNTLTWQKEQIDDLKFAGTKMFHDNISKSTCVKPQSSNYKDTTENNRILKHFYEYSIIYFDKFLQKA